MAILYKHKLNTYSPCNGTVQCTSKLLYLYKSKNQVVTGMVKTKSKSAIVTFTTLLFSRRELIKFIKFMLLYLSLIWSKSKKLFLCHWYCCIKEIITIHLILLFSCVWKRNAPIVNLSDWNHTIQQYFGIPLPEPILQTN